MTVSTLRALPCTLALLAFSAPALAVEEDFQLGLGTTLVSSSTLELEGDGTVETQLERKTTGVGFGGGSGVTLDLGYGITDRLVLGGLLQLRTETVENELEIAGVVTTSSEETTTGVLIGPKLEFLILDDGDVRPFLGAAVAYASVTTENDTDEMDLSGFAVLGGVGLHWFLTPGFSIDPLLQLQYASLSGEIDPSAAGQDETDLDGSLLGYGLGIGFSGWL